MAESIKQIYTNIETMVFSILNNYVGGIFNENMCKSVEYNLLNNIKNYYPFLDIKINLNFNNYSQSLNTNIKIDSSGFPLMSHNNYKTHKFIEVVESNLRDYNYNSYYDLYELKCQLCNIKITESGSPIDGDFSCNEWIIKNIIE